MILTSIKPSLIGFNEGFIFTPYMLLRYIHTVLFVLSLSFSSLAQNKWDLDSVYLAEFGEIEVIDVIDTNAIEIPTLSLMSRPFRPIFGIIDVTTEIELEPNNSMLLGFHHYSYLYRYGQPNDPSISYLLNHYGNYIYEEWVFTNIYSLDFRRYRLNENKTDKRITSYISLLNRFAIQQWEYTNSNIIDNPFYDPDASNGVYSPSPWVPADFDRLKIKILRNYRPGIEFGRRMSSTRIIQPAYLKAKYFEYSLCLTLSYSPWNELLFPILMTNFSLVYF